MISCRRARALLVEHLRGTVTDSSLLLLDQHIATCVGCQRERARCATVGALRTWEPPTLSSAAQSRIIAALREASPRPVEVRRVFVRSPFVWSAAASLAFTAALLLVSRDKPTPTEVAIAAPPANHFADAQFGYRAGTIARLLPRQHAVALDGGELDVTEHIGARPLRIDTPRFIVMIREGRALFAPDEVHVISGEVVIYTKEMAPITTVGAGQTWHVPAPNAVAPAVEHPHPRAAVRIALSDILGQARAALADGDSARARRLIEEALAAATSPRDRAEAELLVAESHLIDHDRDRAIAAYRRVAAEYAQLPEGEEAAFAAAQVLSERGDASEEVTEAFRHYLSRYPDGRFAREARARVPE